jgi:CO/xanthine dehydrogenase Mo-binding subunit
MPVFKTAEISTEDNKMTTASRQKSAGQGGYRVLGTRPIRHDGLDKVNGKAKYSADVQMAGLLHGGILRSPHAHARIVSIDTSRAEALPGVKAAVTFDDFPIIHEQDIDFAATQGSARMMAENDLAYRKVLYKGHAVAAIAATSPNIAEEALALIDVEYEVLPAVLSVLDAMKEDAPILHETMTTTFRVERTGPREDTGVKGNVSGHIQFRGGDLEEGFREAEFIVEREFSTQMVHQGYIEPFASTAYWAPDGHVTVWTSTQGAFGIRAATAAIAGVPESMVKVVPMEIGGGFGGKGVGYLDPVAAVLSRKTGLPVKIVMSRKDVFEGTGPTSGTFMRCKIGVDGEGRITAAQLYLAYEAGAYPGSPVAGGASIGLAPYKIDNLLVDGFDVVCNRPKTQAYRAPGHPQAAFAVETVIDARGEAGNRPHGAPPEERRSRGRSGAQRNPPRPLRL